MSANDQIGSALPSSTLASTAFIRAFDETPECSQFASRCSISSQHAQHADLGQGLKSVCCGNLTSECPAPSKLCAEACDSRNHDQALFSPVASGKSGPDVCCGCGCGEGGTCRCGTVTLRLGAYDPALNPDELFELCRCDCTDCACNDSEQLTRVSPFPVACPFELAPLSDRAPVCFA